MSNGFLGASLWGVSLVSVYYPYKVYTGRQRTYTSIMNCIYSGQILFITLYSTFLFSIYIVLIC